MAPPWPAAPGTADVLMTSRPFGPSGDTGVWVASSAPAGDQKYTVTSTGAAPGFWSSRTVTCVAELLKRGTAYVVSYARMRYTSSGPQSVWQEPLPTRTHWPSTAVEPRLRKRRVREKPMPAGAEDWTTVLPSVSMRSSSSVSPTSPEVASTTTSYDE